MGTESGLRREVCEPWREGVPLVSREEVSVFGAPWEDALQVDPMRVLVNRLRVLADREGWAHLHAVANELVVRLNFYDREHSVPE